MRITSIMQRLICFLDFGGNPGVGITSFLAAAFLGAAKPLEPAEREIIARCAPHNCDFAFLNKKKRLAL